MIFHDYSRKEETYHFTEGALHVGTPVPTCSTVLCVHMHHLACQRLGQNREGCGVVPLETRVRTHFIINITMLTLGYNICFLIF